MTDVVLAKSQTRAAAVTLRPVTEADTAECGQIIYGPFRCVAEWHHFPLDWPLVRCRDPPA